MMKKTVCLLLSCILTVLCLMGAAAAEEPAEETAAEA